VAGAWLTCLGALLHTNRPRAVGRAPTVLWPASHQTTVFSPFQAIALGDMAGLRFELSPTSADPCYPTNLIHSLVCKWSSPISTLSQNSFDAGGFAHDFVIAGLNRLYRGKDYVYNFFLQKIITFASELRFGGTSLLIG
jgi:hypothetical protein